MANPESSFTYVAETAEIPVGKMKVVKIKEEEILIINVDNKFYAIANHCPHKLGDFSNGVIEGNIISCPVHGSRFDVTSGKNIQGPKLFMHRGTTSDLKTYELRIEGGKISVYLRSVWGV